MKSQIGGRVNSKSDVLPVRCWGVIHEDRGLEKFVRHEKRFARFAKELITPVVVMTAARYAKLLRQIRALKSDIEHREGLIRRCGVRIGSLEKTLVRLPKTTKAAQRILYAEERKANGR